MKRVMTTWSKSKSHPRTMAFPLLVLFLSGCLQQIDPQAPQELSSQSTQDFDASTTAFSNSLHPLIKTNCSNCHGIAQAPLFAFANDIQKAHDNVSAFNLVNLSAPDASRLVAKVASNHHCWTGDCAADSLAIRDSIQKWATDRSGEESTENQEVSNEALVSHEVLVPEDLPNCGISNNESKKILIALWFDGAPEGTIIGFQICELDEFSYLAFNLKLKAAVAIKLKAPHLRINGIKTAAGGNDWVLEEKTIPGDGGDIFEPASLVSSGQVIFEKAFGLSDPSQGGKGKDKLSLSFEILEKAETPSE